ncbi:MAG: FtsW/RodA/SpoVE family cell cycle protein [Oscillospiraceae bacterium]|jgi:cell division protein FtsW (lipid II flippase)|nr:FtsW/RodA/SpoVE family cell cycle protein [Oscillospiraceae bacterium]
MPSRRLSIPVRVPWFWLLLLATAFQLFSFAPLLLDPERAELPLYAALLGYIPLEWLFLILVRALAHRRHVELEILGLWLSGIGLAVCGSVSADYALKQLAAIALGMGVYALLMGIMASPDLAMKLRTPAAVGAVGLLALNLLLAKVINGTLNWITVGPISIQPSELVKLAFIFVGAATLEKLQTAPSVTRYLLFAMGCVGALFLMRDFGAALIFFATYIILAFLRSGDLKSIALVSAAAVMGAGLVIYFRPYVANRFSVYRHVWEHIHDTGYQQTRVLMYSSSGGLLGLGLGQGKLRGVFAASTDLVFGMLCEEWGILLAVLVLVSYLGMAAYVLHFARQARSAFYAIASVSAAGLILFQAALNVFGITDLLPLTGVTLPFVSRGGTSILCAWGLLAFLSSVTLGERKEASLAQE